MLAKGFFAEPDFAGLFVAKAPMVVGESTGVSEPLLYGASIREVARRRRPSRRTVG
jgi:hypothetical protein